MAEREGNELSAPRPAKKPGVAAPGPNASGSNPVAPNAPASKVGPNASGPRPVVKKSPIPGYVLEAEVGRGGMGIVYRARQESIGRVVAVKVLPPQATKNQQFVERFLREAKAAAKLNHENVVAAIDAGRAGEVVYFVMEFVDGETARERLDRGGPLPIADVLRILRDTAAALVHAQRHSLVHRDVKPDNIMLNKDGRAQLCDLGLARLAPQAGDPLTGARTGIAEGTPYYMAPEQARGFADIDLRADLYALGATAYHLLTGEYPFDGEDARAVMVKAVNDPFPDIAAKRKDAPRALVDLVRRLTVKDREKRLQSPEEVLRALDALIAPQTPPPMRAEAPERSRTPLVAGAAAGALLLAVLAMKLTGGKPADIDASRDLDPRKAAGGADPAREKDPQRVAKTERQADPRPRAAPSQTTREAEASLRLQEIRVLLGARPDPREAVRRYRWIAEKYGGTKAASDADAEARTIEQRQADSLDRKLRDLATIAGDQVNHGDFAAAADQYAPLLAEEKGGPGEEKIAAALAQVDKLCLDALKKAEARARALAAKDDFAGAEKVLDEFAARATEAPRARTIEIKSSLAAAHVSNEAAKEAKETADTVRAMLRQGQYDEALVLLDKAAADPRFAPYKPGIDSMRANVETTRHAAEAVRKRFAALAGQEVEIPLVAGESIAGKVIDFDYANMALRLREPGVKEPIPVRIREMGAAFVVKTVAAEASYDGHFGAALVLLYQRAIDAAAAELKAAAALKPVPPSVEAELKQAQDALPEVVAAGCLDRVHALLLEKGRHEKALACAERLRTGDLKDTAFAKSRASDIRAAWVKARAAQLVEGPLQSLFEGKVTGKRGQRATVSYTFNEAKEVGDWFADAKVPGFEMSRATWLSGSCEMTGRVVWRGAFKGDAQLEASVRTVASNGLVSTPANANFVLYDKGAPWTGWFVGVAATCPTASNFHLSPQAPVKPGAMFAMPCHMIGRSQGTFATTDWLWASRGPAVPGGTAYKVDILSKNHRIAAGFLNTPIPSLPIPAEDQEGGVAIEPFGSKVNVDSVRLQGVIDEAWLEKAAAARANLDFQR